MKIATSVSGPEQTHRDVRSESVMLEPHVGFRGTADIVRSGDQAHR